MRRHIQAALELSGALALAICGNAMVNAQDGSLDTQIPARFTATLGEGVFSDQTVTTVAIVDASDPRISGTWNETTGISVSDLTDGAGDVVTVWWHDITILNDAGSWVATRKASVARRTGSATSQRRGRRSSLSEVAPMRA